MAGAVPRRAVAAMIELIRTDLALLGIHHDLFASEAEVQERGAADRALALLARTAWSMTACSSRPRARRRRTGSRSSCRCSARPQFGDDQDRPIKKSDGSWTYFGADLAYHLQKAENADELIDIWGADHAGTVKRIKAAVAALTDGPVAFDVKLVQMVRLLRAGEPVKMSKRSGNFVTLADVVERGRQGRGPLHHADPQGRRADGLRLRQGGRGVEGQSGLLRPICPCPDPLARRARRRRRASTLPGAADLSLLDEDELALVKLAAQFPRDGRERRRRARAAPHRLLPRRSRRRVPRLVEPRQRRPRQAFPPGTESRTDTRALALAAAIGQIIRNGLGIMGVTAAEEM